MATYIKWGIFEAASNDQGNDLKLNTSLRLKAQVSLTAKQISHFCLTYLGFVLHLGKYKC